MRTLNNFHMFWASIQKKTQLSLQHRHSFYMALQPQLPEEVQQEAQPGSSISSPESKVLTRFLFSILPFRTTLNPLLSENLSAVHTPCHLCLFSSPFLGFRCCCFGLVGVLLLFQFGLVQFGSILQTFVLDVFHQDKMPKKNQLR